MFRLTLAGAQHQFQQRVDFFVVYRIDLQSSVRNTLVVSGCLGRTSQVGPIMILYNSNPVYVGRYDRLTNPHC